MNDFMNWLRAIIVFVRASRLSRLLGYYEKGELHDPGRLPKKIFIYWDKGKDAAPDIVQHCIESWIDKNPNWKLYILDEKAASEYFPRNATKSKITTAMYSDILRLSILRTEGGVWVDSTCLCTRPLDDWLPIYFCQAELFLFSNPGKDRAIASWFIASVPKNQVIENWYKSLEFLCNIGLKRLPYFSMHYLFEANNCVSHDLRKSTESLSKVSANASHLMQKLLLDNQLPTEKEIRILRSCPVHKLTWKKDIDLTRLQAVFQMID